MFFVMRKGLAWYARAVLNAEAYGIPFEREHLRLVCRRDVSLAKSVKANVCPAAQQNLDGKIPELSLAAATNIIYIPHQL